MSAFSFLRHNSLPNEDQYIQRRTDDWRPSMTSPYSESQPYQSTGRPFFTNMSLAKDQPLSASDGGVSASSDFSEKSFLRFHHHSLSGSTYCSNDSSPTTTCSTLDDSSATEPSPNSSPESPPLVGSFQLGMQRPQSNDEARPFFELQQAAPAKKGRNLKNLAVNTSRNTDRMPSLTSVPQTLQRQETAPSIMSPSFVKPPEPPKRRPSNLGLTILTPSSVHSNSSPQQIRLAIPTTSGFARPATLRHFQSSPSLPLVTGFHDEGKIARIGPLDTIFSPLEQVQTLPVKEEDEEQNFDIPLSQEEKPDAYPNGPITVYSPYVDLFLEPTAEEARQYDVILNVASEVRNPFIVDNQPRASEPEVRLDGGGGLSYAPKRALQTTDESNGSPTTPKATPLVQAFPTEPVPSRPEPEYIHIPWEHNSDIVPDLLGLVKLIDERVEQGKRVLVHCQCGVSRSASLVVAYGLYKEPTMSVQEAYDTVKLKSKWIGPNMNLIMQLQEFRSSLAHGGVLPIDRNLSPVTPASAFGEWRSPFSMRSNDAGPNSGAASAGLLQGFSKSETTIPLAEVPAIPLTAGARVIRPRAVSAVRRTSAYVDPAGHVVPVLSIATTAPREALVASMPESDSTTPTLTSPRSAEFAMTSLQPAKEVESMDAFGLMSPTSTEFSSSPFDRSLLLAAIGMTGHTGHAQPALPTRTRSLKSNLATKQTQLSPPPPARKLRSRISSPSLKQQQQLHTMQTQIEAQLPRHTAEAPIDLSEALMSPRVTEFTTNPFALAFDPPTPTLQDSSRAPAIDPRSPAHKGASPIIRNIEDFL